MALRVTTIGAACLAAFLAGSAWSQSVPPEIAHQGAEVYQAHCSVCHDHPQDRIPSRSRITVTRSADYVLRALTVGVMSQQASALSTEERKAVAAYLIGKLPGTGADVDITANRCQHAPPPLTLRGSYWNGWSGRGTSNVRYPPDPGLATADVPKLKLKWAFAYPGGTSTPPAIVGGRIFVPSMGGVVYSLDAHSGCTYWATELGSASRAAMSIGKLPSGKFAAYVGDWKGEVLALDADTGKELWRARVEDHPMVRLTGAPTLSDGRLYVPVSSFEETAVSDPNYICCTFRGSVVALDAATGRILWKTYTIDQPPQPRGDKGRIGPAGAAVWSAPTIDPKRGLLYMGTGNAYTAPAAPGSDSVIALDLKTGAKRWVSQLIPDDAFIVGCASKPQANCPEGTLGPDFDVGSSPLQVRLPNGKERLIVTSKSGDVFGLDIDQQGKLLWRTKVGRGGLLGGIEWGGASDNGARIFVTVSDWGTSETDSATPGVYAVSTTSGERLWTVAAPKPACAWGEPCSHAHFAAPIVIPGVVFAGAFDGHEYAYSVADGHILWDFDTGHSFDAVNGGKANGGSIDQGGQTIADGTLLVNSGGRNGYPGNALLAFTVDGK
jgi:polyvinyl alcohol dehydrogenase (cytochrome)